MKLKLLSKMLLLEADSELPVTVNENMTKKPCFEFVFQSLVL